MNTESEGALRAVATQLGASRTDLERIAASLDVSPVPHIADFAAEALDLLSGRTLHTYRHHIERLVSELGERRLDEVSVLDLERVALGARAWALEHHNARHGFGAQESFVSATRFFFACAVKAGHLRESPARALVRPRRRRSARRALSSEETRMIVEAIVATSRDLDLDLLIFAFARETACRWEGLLNALVADLQPAPSVILYEKFDERREIPLSPQLAEALRQHAASRHPGCGRVFHYSDGRCLTERRLDTLFGRIGDHLPWAAALGVSLHWIRYTTLTDIRMTGGERVAAAYAGHGDETGGITGRYTRATFAELQAAHHRLFVPASHPQSVPEASHWTPGSP